MRSLLSPRLLALSALACTLFALDAPAQSLREWTGYFRSDDGRSIHLRLSDSKLVGDYRLDASTKSPLTIAVDGDALDCDTVLAARDLGISFGD